MERQIKISETFEYVDDYLWKELLDRFDEALKESELSVYPDDKERFLLAVITKYANDIVLSQLDLEDNLQEHFYFDDKYLQVIRDIREETGRLNDKKWEKFK